MKKIILFGSIGFIAVSFMLQWIIDKFDTQYFSGIVANLMAEVFGILITYVVIQKLIDDYNSKEQVRYEKRKKEEAISIFYELVGIEFKSFIFDIASRYTNFLIKDSPQSNKDSYIDIWQYLNNIDNYIGQDFCKKGIKVLQPISNNINELFSIEFDKRFEKVEYEYQSFCKFDFKDYIDNRITIFLSRYISVMPTEISSRILKISNLIKSPILTTIKDAGLEGNLALFEGEIKTEELKRVLMLIGENIAELQEHSKKIV